MSNSTNPISPPPRPSHSVQVQPRDEQAATESLKALRGRKSKVYRSDSPRLSMLRRIRDSLQDWFDSMKAKFNRLRGKKVRVEKSRRVASNSPILKLAQHKTVDRIVEYSSQVASLLPEAREQYNDSIESLDAILKGHEKGKKLQYNYLDQIVEHLKALDALFGAEKSEDLAELYALRDTHDPLAQGRQDIALPLITEAKPNSNVPPSPI